MDAKLLRQFGRPYHSNGNLIIPFGNGKIIYDDFEMKWKFEEKITAADNFAEEIANDEYVPDGKDLLNFSACTGHHIKNVQFGVGQIVWSVKFMDHSEWKIPTRNCETCKAKTNCWNNICLGCKNAIQ